MFRFICYFKFVVCSLKKVLESEYDPSSSSDNLSEMDAKLGPDAMYCDGCNHTPCLWDIYSSQVTTQIEEEYKNESNITKRHKAYRLYTDIVRELNVHEWTGTAPHMTMKIDDCTVNGIRENWPNKSGRPYVGHLTFDQRKKSKLS